MHSMTGFGRGSASDQGLTLMVELKSVNHRFLDLSFRLPRALQSLEIGLRKQIGERLQRGHLDISYSFSGSGGLEPQVTADLPLASAYLKAAEALAQHAGLKQKLKLKDLLQLPDLLVRSEAQVDEEALAALAGQALSQALDQLVSSRLAEGEAMRQDLTGHLEALSRIQQQMVKLAPLQVDSFHSRLRERLKGIEMEGLEPQRLAQEVAIFADRVAVDEELARLLAHIEQMADIMQKGGAMGRKLDFLAQEMGREVNTIASKSSLIELTRLSLEGKNCVEKIREQVQNLE